MDLFSDGKPTRVSFGNPLEMAFLQDEQDDVSFEAGIRVATFEGTMTKLMDGLL